MSQTYDVIVLGLGAMGTAAAYHLANRGQRVLGLERFAPAHDQGSSHGQSRIIRQAYYENPSYVPLLLRAYELWNELNHASGETVMLVTGGVMLGEPDTDVMRGSIRSAREHNLQHDLLDAAEIRARWPQFRAPDGTIALYERLGGVIFPELAILAHQRLAQEAGATLQFGETAQSWQVGPSGDGVEVITDGGRYTAERLVLSAGAWMPELLPEFPLTVQRNVLYWFEPDGGTAPFASGRCPIYIWDTGDLSFYGFPALPGTPAGVKVAFHNHGPLCAPETIDRAIHQTEIDEMRGWLAEYVPSLAHGSLLDARTCMYTLTPDHDFMLGLHPQHQQIVIASPCSGHGYKFASVVGEVLADLATTGSTGHPIGWFSPARFLG